MDRNVKRVARAVRDWWQRPVLEVQQATLQATQLHLRLRYQELLRSGGPIPPLEDFGFRVYGDTDEDGILLFLFAALGVTSGVLVDIGSASCNSSNTANLLIHHGWRGLLVDADEESISLASSLFAANPRTRLYPPKIVNAFVNAENVNDLLVAEGVVGDIDLLSIDVDGMDLWLWKAIEVVKPRVVVIEFQDILGAERSVSVPYSADFRADAYPENRELRNYVGASLPAMVNVGREKGYRLVGVNRLGFNAFFVMDNLLEDVLPGRDPSTLLNHPWNEYGAKVRYPQVQHMDWISI